MTAKGVISVKTKSSKARQTLNLKNSTVSRNIPLGWIYLHIYIFVQTDGLNG